MRQMAAYPDPQPVIPLPESIAAQVAYQLRYKNTVTEYYSWVSCHGHGVNAVCVFITAGPITKLFAGGEEESGGHVL